MLMLEQEEELGREVHHVGRKCWKCCRPQEDGDMRSEEALGLGDRMLLDKAGRY